MNEEYFNSERKISQIYFTTAQTSEILGELQYTVRFWVKEFHVYRKKLPNTRKWLYPKTSVAKLHTIKNLLREQKFTIEGAKLKIKQNHAWANL